MLDCDCPHCGSRSTKALSVLHGDGTRDSTYRRNGWFYYRRSFGVHSSRGRGRSQTLTSQLAAPPVAPTTQFLKGGGVLITLIIGGILGGATGFWIAFCVLVARAIFGGMHDTTTQDERYRLWSSSFRCSRCGTVFAVIDSAPYSYREAPSAEARVERQINPQY